MGIVARLPRKQSANAQSSDSGLDKTSNLLSEKRKLSYLRRGLSEAGGKLPLFDLDGQAFEPAIVRACLEAGWAEPWFANPLKPDWLVCKLTSSGRTAVLQALG